MGKKTAKGGMKKQLVAQLRKGSHRKASAEAPPFEMSKEELAGQLSRNAQERAEVETFPCKDCGEETNYNNRSIKQDGTVIHIGCKKAPKPSGEPVKRKLAGLPKHKGAKIPAPPKPAARTHGDVVPCADYQARTCLQLQRDVNTVTYVDVASMLSHGLHLQYMSVQKFDERYKPIEGYPVEKAVAKYQEFAAEYGATQDVLDRLARVVKPKQEDTEMAKKKMAEKKGASGAAAKSSGKKGGSRSSGGGIGALIREMLGKGQDADAILSAVKKKFPDAKTTKGNIAWYRADMRKKGQKVPEPKGKKAA